nr:unnamed protein product [Digitaria exilis]
MRKAERLLMTPSSSRWETPREEAKERESGTSPVELRLASTSAAGDFSAMAQGGGRLAAAAAARSDVTQGQGGRWLVVLGCWGPAGLLFILIVG